MGELKLFRLYRADDDYGVTVEAIVAAHDELTARVVIGRHENDHGSSRAFGWVDETVTTIEHIGFGTPGTEPGVIMTKESAS